MRHRRVLRHAGMSDVAVEVQLRVDLTNRTFQYDYPDRYFVKAADTTSILADTRRRSVWKGNWGASAGVIIPLFR